MVPRIISILSILLTTLIHIILPFFTRTMNFVRNFNFPYDLVMKHKDKDLINSKGWKNIIFSNILSTNIFWSMPINLEDFSLLMKKTMKPLMPTSSYSMENIMKIIWQGWQPSAKSKVCLWKYHKKAKLM